MSKPRFETFTGKDGQHYARLKARNGKTLFTSEGYTEERGAEEAIFLVIGIIQAAYYEVLPEG